MDVEVVCVETVVGVVDVSVEVEVSVVEGGVVADVEDEELVVRDVVVVVLAAAKAAKIASQLALLILYPSKMYGTLLLAKRLM